MGEGPVTRKVGTWCPSHTHSGDERTASGRIPSPEAVLFFTCLLAQLGLLVLRWGRGFQALVPQGPRLAQPLAPAYQEPERLGLLREPGSGVLPSAPRSFVHSPSP